MRARLLFCLLLTSLAFSSAYAQIPNAGFESWTGNTPDHWVTSNAAPLYDNVTVSATAHSGSRAVRGDVVAYFGSYLASPVIQSGEGGEGFAVNQGHIAVTGYYQFFPVGGDKLGLNFGMFQNGDGIAIGAMVIENATSGYTPFTVPFTTIKPGTPDTCILQFLIIGPGTNGTGYHQGSYFLIDDLAFSISNGIVAPEEKPHEFQLGQNFPNPFNPSTTISYELPVAGHVSLRVYDLLGQEVAVLVDADRAAGKHAATFDGRSFSSGFYLYKLDADGFVATKRMMLVK